MDLSEWGITYKEIHPRKSKWSNGIGQMDQLIANETRSQAEILEERMRKSLYPYHQLCFKWGESNHLLQSCPSSAWSDLRDCNILSCRGRRIGLSKDVLKSRDSLQQLMDHLAHGWSSAPEEPTGTSTSLQAQRTPTPHFLQLQTTRSLW
jgi:hypothetical protein